MNIIEEMIAEMRENSELLFNMAGIYPGDTSGAISKDAWLLGAAAEYLSKIKWENEYSLINLQNEVTVTYG